ncbi:MAG: protoheme IX farnesyltransferase, partial [Pseudomonadota bacterium]|nr:protoheme IX farnesyltransferase [Pseudomonadota bacterium]
FVGMSAWIYLTAAMLLGLGFIYSSAVLLRHRNSNAPMLTFRYSIWYLGLLFAALLIDHSIIHGF